MVGDSIASAQQRSQHKLTNALQFFGQKDGCLDLNCPFLHDREAVLADRKQMLEKRRETFDYKHRPTVHQQMTRYHSVLNCMAGNDKALRAEIEKSEQIDEEVANDRAYCANPQMDEDRKPLKVCKRCKYTLYC
jgi:hypothetical protein